MKYEIDGNYYDVIITKKGNKNTYIKVKEDLKIYVSTNYFATKSYIKKLLSENEDALRKMLNQMKKRCEKKDLFFYLGNSYDIIIVSTINDIDIDYENKVIYVKSIKELEKWYNKQIRSIFLDHFNSIFNSFKECDKIPCLKIRKMKSRWGVYNKVSHSVTLNSELIKYKLEALDYVIVHELCHIIHFDHSKDFWNLVEKYYPEYKRIRKYLKE